MIFTTEAYLKAYIITTGIIIFISVLVIIIMKIKVKIKNDVIDNLCKDNHNLLKGYPKKVMERMRNDLSEGAYRGYWHKHSKQPPHNKRILLTDKDYEEIQIIKYKQGLIIQEKFIYWALLPLRRPIVENEKVEVEK